MSTDRPTTALAVIEPTNMSELQVFAKTATASGFYMGLKSPEQAQMIMMSGRDLGLSYTQSLRAFHVINGRPTMSADGMVAVCLGHANVCEYFVTVETSADKCTVETKRRGSPTPQRLTFTMTEAKAAGLSGGNWSKYPAAMLRARARSALARDVYPDLLMGLYDPDEVGEYVEPVRAEVASPAPQPQAKPEAIDAEFVEAPKPRPPTLTPDIARAKIAEMDLDVAAVEEWLAAIHSKPIADRNADELDGLLRNLAVGKKRREEFSQWFLAKAQPAAESK